MTRKLFVSFSMLGELIRARKVTQADLDEGLFVMLYSSREHCIGQLGQEHLTRKMGMNVKKIFSQIETALLKAEREGRAFWPPHEDGNVKPVSQFLASKGLEPLLLGQRPEWIGNYSTFADRINETNPDLEVVWR